MMAGYRKVGFHCNYMPVMRENGQTNFGTLIHYLLSVKRHQNCHLKRDAL